VFPAGSLIEDACIAVAICEVNALIFSKHGEALTPFSGYLAPEEGVAALWEKIHAVQRAHELTWGEVARAVHHLSNSYLNWIVRIERHGDDPDARADLAC
jgi:hypothetical protein